MVERDFRFFHGDSLKISTNQRKIIKKVLKSYSSDGYYHTKTVKNRGRETDREGERERETEREEKDASRLVNFLSSEDTVIRVSLVPRITLDRINRHGVACWRR